MSPLSIILMAPLVAAAVLLVIIRIEKRDLKTIPDGELFFPWFLLTLFLVGLGLALWR